MQWPRKYLNIWAKFKNVVSNVIASDNKHESNWYFVYINKL